MPIEGPTATVVVVPDPGGGSAPGSGTGGGTTDGSPRVLSYVDRRDMLNRLTRVHIEGSLAQTWLTVLDPVSVREISDAMLAWLVGGIASQPSGGGGGPGPYSLAYFPEPGLYPGSAVYPSDATPGPAMLPGSYGQGPYGAGRYGA